MKAENSTYKLERLLFGLLIAFLFIQPWVFYGGEVIWGLLAQATLALGLLTITLIGLSISQITIRGKLKTLKIPLILIFTWLLLTVFQTKISSSPFLSSLEAIKYCLYISLFLLTLILVNTKKRILLTTKALFISSALTALYSLSNYYANGSMEAYPPLPPWDFYTNKVIHGPFSYKNHYASFLLLTIPLGIGLAIADKYKSGNQLPAFKELVTTDKLIFIILTITMSTVLMLSASRAGNGAFFLSCLITALAVVKLNRIKISLRKQGKALGAAIVILIVLAWSGIIDTLAYRYENSSDNGRSHLRDTAYTIIKEHPILGSGPGTYPIIHKQYKSDMLNGSIMWQRVHNDYLELLSTQGLIGFTIFASAIAFLFFRLFKGIKMRGNPLYSIQVACFCSVVGALIHCVADFNFQLPIIASYFFVIIALGVRCQTVKSISNAKRKIQL